MNGSYQQSPDPRLPTRDSRPETPDHCTNNSITFSLNRGKSAVYHQLYRCNMAVNYYLTLWCCDHLSSRFENATFERFLRMPYKTAFDEYGEYFANQHLGMCDMLRNALMNKVLADRTDGRKQDIVYSEPYKVRDTGISATCATWDMRTLSDSIDDVPSAPRSDSVADVPSAPRSGVRRRIVLNPSQGHTKVSIKSRLGVRKQDSRFYRNTRRAAVDIKKQDTKHNRSWKSRRVNNRSHGFTYKREDTPMTERCHRHPWKPRRVDSRSHGFNARLRKQHEHYRKSIGSRLYLD